MLEHSFGCPHCMAQISMLLDPSRPEQNYIEDCEICCQPIEVTVRFQEDQLTDFQAEPIEQ